MNLITKKTQKKVKESEASSFVLKDEMNFADAGGIVFAHHDPSVKTIVHEEEQVNFEQGQRNSRRITITASDNCRLPLPSDAKVLVALISLSAPNDFDTQRVSFSLREVLRILDWVPDGRNYERVKGALERLRSVRFIFKNTWYLNGTKAYTSEDFNILDYLKLVGYDETREQGNLERCTIKWSDTLYRSFKESNVKGLDLYHLQTLGDLAFTIYRFLDKAFYFRSRLEYDLESFAKQMGIQRTKANNLTKIKRRLFKAFAELEESGYLVPLKEDDRFTRVKRGVWRITLIRSVGLVSSHAASPLLAKLLEHGVSEKQAEKIVAEHDEEYVAKVIEYFDTVVLKTKNIRSPGGWLNNAFSNPDFQFPKGFESRFERDRRERFAREEAEEREQNRIKAEREQESKSKEEETQHRTYWESLSIAEQFSLEQRAVLATTEALRSVYERGKDEQSPAWRSVRDHIIREQIGREMGECLGY